MDLIPGCEKFDYELYSGYLKVNDDKQLHYVFVESEQDAKNAPLLIWFNGGPGCSSLLGFIQEMGPCVVDDGETEFFKNKHPWNNRTNMLYIEQPAGVGFSYGAKGSRHFNDNLSSEDNLVALLDFYEKFPEFKERDLYISGESYGGIYVPYMSWRIYQHNENAKVTKDLHVPLKGFIVANGATDWHYDTTPSYLPMAYMHNLMDGDLWRTFQDNNCTFYFLDIIEGHQPKVCKDAMKTFQRNTARINWYDIYRKVYDDDEGLKGGDDRMATTQVGGRNLTYKRGFTPSEYTPWLKEFSDPQKEPVLGDEVSKYFNRADVRKAFNIPDTMPEWIACQYQDWSYDFQKEGSIWIYPILQHKYKMLVFSGDTDGAVPAYGSE